MKTIIGFALVLALGVQSTIAAPTRLNIQGAPTSAKTATIHIHLVSNFGIALLSEVSVDTFQDRLTPNQRNLAGRFKGGVATGIPFGVYLLRASANGFWTAEREVRVFQSDVSTVVALEPGGVDGGLLANTATVSGKVLTGQPNLLHVRLAGVFSSTIMDANLKADGSFEFSGVPQGVYLLIAIREGDPATTSKGEVQYSSTVNVPLSAPLQIKLVDK